MRATTPPVGRFMSIVIGVLLLAGRAATAGPAGAVTGEGTRGDWSVTLNVPLGPDDAARGQLLIRGRLEGATVVTCRYETFPRMLILVNQARFDASAA
jgi:hypothetical protein